MAGVLGWRLHHVGRIGSEIATAKFREGGNLLEMGVEVVENAIRANRASGDDQIGCGHGEALTAELVSEANRAVEILLQRSEFVKGGKIGREPAPLFLIASKGHDLDPHNSVAGHFIVADRLRHRLPCHVEPLGTVVLDPSGTIDQDHEERRSFCSKA